MSILIFIIFSLSSLFGGGRVVIPDSFFKKPLTEFQNVNPLFFNEQKNRNILTPIFKENRLKNSFFLLDAKERIYIYEKDKNSLQEIILRVSLDGRVFEEIKLHKELDYFTYKNPFDKKVAIELFGYKSKNVSIYVSKNDSKIHNLFTKEISLSKAKREEIVSPKIFATENFYYLKPHKKYSFKAKGVLTLIMTSKTSSIEALIPYRQRIFVDINKTTHPIEILNSLSYSYVNDGNKTGLTQKTKHFFLLGKNEQNITIQTPTPIFLLAKEYKDYILNPINKSSYIYDTNHRLEHTFEPIWKNSIKDGGLYRHDKIVKSSLFNRLYDSKEEREQYIIANKSTFFKPIFPSIMPYDIRYCYYHIASLNNNEELSRLNSFKPKLSWLNEFKKGAFTKVPLIDLQNSKGVVKRKERSIYFRTRAFKLTKENKREIENFLAHSINYKHIYLNAHTDRTWDYKNNLKLSKKRCLNVKNYLIKLGVNKKDISCSFYGEKKNKIATKDEIIEDTNRRVEFEVSYNSPKYKNLEYLLKKPLKEKRELEVSICVPKDGNYTLFLDITTPKGVKRKKFYFSKNLEEYRFSKAIKYKKREFLKTLKGEDLKVILNSGTIKTILPKGTSKFQLYNPDIDKNFKVALRIQENSVYKDSPYRLATRYQNTYKEFAKSLHKPLLKDKKFNGWYEHTHPLRLLMKRVLNHRFEGLNRETKLTQKDFNYAKKLINIDKTSQTAKQILKHFIFSKDEAYRWLLKLSNSKQEEMIYHIINFSLTKNPKTLKKIGLLLIEAKQYKYALDTFLILPKNQNKKLLEYLALRLNKVRLYEEISQKKLTQKEFLKKKKDILEKEEENLKYFNSAGVQKVYSKERNLYIDYYKATAFHPLELEINKKVSLDIEVRFDENITRYEWLYIEDNGKIYHYPLTQIAPSNSLITTPENRTLSIANRLTLNLKKGKHKLKIHGYEKNLLINIKTKKAPKIVLPLNKQILKTSNFNSKEWLSPLKESRPYLISLLWNYHYGNLYYKYHSLAGATILSKTIKDKNLKSLLTPILEYAYFSPFYSVETPLGFYEQNRTSWSPNAKIEKERLPLLNLKDYHTIIHNRDKTILNIEGGQNFTMELELITPKFYPKKPLSFIYKLNNNKEKIVNLKDSFKKSFKLKNELNQLSLELIKPLTFQYLGINFYENKERVEPDFKEKFYITSKENPVIIHTKGVVLLRVEEIYNNKREEYYIYLDKRKLYHYKIFPTKGEKSLISISKLSFNPLKKKLEVFRDKINPTILFEKEKRIIEKKKIKDKLIKIDYASYFPTISLEFLKVKKEIGSDDTKNNEIISLDELGIYFRYQWATNRYFKLHYFKSFYNSPMYGFEHIFRNKSTLLLDTWYDFAINYYTQKNGLNSFKTLSLKTSIEQKKSFSSSWIMQYGAGAFKHFLKYEKIDINELLDSRVYSRYKRDHQQGTFGEINFFYRPYEDTILSLTNRATSNRSLWTIDNIKTKLKLQHYIDPFEISLYLNRDYYYEDLNRENGYSIYRVGASIDYERFFGLNRLNLSINANKQLNSDNLQLTFGVIWHFSQNREYFHIAPNEESFHSLKRKLNKD